MKRLSLALALVLAASAWAAIIIRNVTEWSVYAQQPPAVKVLGRDRGNPLYNVKLARAWWAVEDGLNVTYVEVTVPRCHRAVFDPVLNLTVGEALSARLEAVSLTGSYAPQLSLNISLAGVRQVSVRNGVITQPSGSPVAVTGTASFRAEVLVGSGAPLGAEVARLETWLRLTISGVHVSQKVVWVVRTPSAPPRVVLFYDGFESGSLEGWNRTTYTYAERKLYDVSVTERCYQFGRRPTPSTITDTTRPVAGSWLAWIGFREQVICEPEPEGRDYLRRSVPVPASIDGVEVRFVNVTFWWRLMTWDSANYDYVNLTLTVDATRYFFKERYNPNPGNSFGPFRDTGWQRNSTLFEGLAGRTATIEFLLRTHSDSLYRSWLYVDEVYFVVHFDCASGAVVLALGMLTDPLVSPFALGEEIGPQALPLSPSLEGAGANEDRGFCCGEEIVVDE
ncbi:MAG: hypothetical protein QXH81_09075 [Thermofilaceae archaeon]